MPEIQGWPNEYPLYKQSCFYSWDDACDMLVGPCCCGAWHQDGEFELKDGVLYRYGEKVEFLGGEARCQGHSIELITIKGM